MTVERDPDRPYREYQLARPILIAQVKRTSKVSLEHIARWCGGEVVRAHSATSKAIGIRLNPADGEPIAPIGTYIVQSVTGGFFVITPERFAIGYRRWTKREQQESENQ